MEKEDFQAPSVESYVEFLPDRPPQPTDTNFNDMTTRWSLPSLPVPRVRSSELAVTNLIPIDLDVVVERQWGGKGAAASPGRATARPADAQQGHQNLSRSSRRKPTEQHQN